VNCTEFIAKLDELFERHNIHHQLRDDLRAHLVQCDHCVVTYNTTRQTIEIYRNNELYELPDALQEKLHTAIIERCAKSKKRRC
jgi:alpha-galactosidase